jgi:hypothetical protein
MVDQGASADEIEAISSVLAGAGITGPCAPAIPLNAEGMWLVLITMAPAAFVGSVVARYGEEAWKEIRDFFTAVRAARHGDFTGTGQVVFRQRVLTEEDVRTKPGALPGYRVPGDESTELMLTNEVPDRGYRSLPGLDLSEERGVLVYWEPRDDDWRAVPPPA